MPFLSSRFLVGRRNRGSETLGVAKTIAVIGAGVSGLTSAILLAEQGHRTAIFAEEIGLRTTSAAAGEMHATVRFEKLEDVEPKFDLVINCAGIGARTLVHDPDLEPHRGQVALVPKMDLGCAIVCDDAPLTYIIPRTNDCVFGGTNDLSDNRAIEPATT